ncbi:hypothetical protein FPV67DRAFT_1649771 [Lyophyllum atratum]|nr:hypothetical protein FPV67DRAFT_1649771 [Lyophyllum atratum]
MMRAPASTPSWLCAALLVSRRTGMRCGDPICAVPYQQLKNPRQRTSHLPKTHAKPIRGLSLSRRIFEFGARSSPSRDSEIACTNAICNIRENTRRRLLGKGPVDSEKWYLSKDRPGNFEFTKGTSTFTTYHRRT